MKKTFRIIGVVAVIVVLFAAIVASMNNKPSNSEKVWDEQMTLGNPEANNYFIVYSDIVCPYCVAFENAIIENEEEFQQYLKDGKFIHASSSRGVMVSDMSHKYWDKHFQCAGRVED